MSQFNAAAKKAGILAAQLLEKYMHTKIIIVLADPVVAMDLAQSLEDNVPSGGVISFPSLADATDALVDHAPAALAVLDIPTRALEERDPREAANGIAAQLILLSDTVDELTVRDPDLILLPRTFTTEMITQAVTMMNVGR
ncbi:MAG: hypothetical protein ACJAVM_002921 [Sulfitobacter sp.]|jgi:hypothetical protein